MRISSFRFFCGFILAFGLAIIISACNESIPRDPDLPTFKKVVDFSKDSIEWGGAVESVQAWNSEAYNLYLEHGHPYINKGSSAIGQHKDFGGQIKAYEVIYKAWPSKKTIDHFCGLRIAIKTDSILRKNWGAFGFEMIAGLNGYPIYGVTVEGGILKEPSSSKMYKARHHFNKISGTTWNLHVVDFEGFDVFPPDKDDQIREFNIVFRGGGFTHPTEGRLLLKGIYVLENFKTIPLEIDTSNIVHPFDFNPSE